MNEQLQVSAIRCRELHVILRVSTQVQVTTKGGLSCKDLNKSINVFMLNICLDQLM